MKQIIFKRISQEFSDLPLPAYQSAGSAGMDVTAAVQTEIELHSGEYTAVPTNLSAEIPQGYEIQVRPRSGLALKHGVTVLNSPGTIDSDYRGEIKILLINHGKNSFVIKRGERIAQLVLSQVIQAKIVESDSLSETERGDGGFGSTGVK